MPVPLADVTIHIDEFLDDVRLKALADKVHEQEAVVNACCSPEHPHLMIITYNPQRIHSHQLLEMVRAEGVGAELTGM